MNTNSKLIAPNILCLIFCFILTSCDTFLNVEPKDRISSEKLFSSTTNAEFALNTVYSGIPGAFNTRDPLDNWTDNSIIGISAGDFSRDVYSQGIYTPSNISIGAESFGHNASWKDLYSSIRNANIFINNVSKSPLPGDWKQIRIAEARFLRAYFYSLLWTRFGGVPIIMNVQHYNESNNNIFQSRNSAKETFNFISGELSEVIKALPVNSNEPGRVTKGAALTLKAWCELYWASPIYNDNNVISRWTAAADTYKSIIDMKKYSLFSDYNSQFVEDNNWNDETIFAKSYIGGTDLGGSREGLQGPWGVNGIPRSYGGVNPTQELVDAYFMKNGLHIHDPQSGYNPQRPYSNRSKRFYQSIAFDGTVWLGDTLIMKQGVGSINATDVTNKGNGTVTGYYLIKGMDPDHTVHGYNNLNSANYIIFRYAEVLLGYAEAYNEANGPDASVYNAVNKVRERVQLPPLQTGLTQDELRKAIQQERRVELAFEDKRWYDLIRLKLAEKKLNGNLNAMVIENSAGKWSYKIQPIPDGSMVFDPNKNYLLPIPIEAIERNPELKQNPGY